MEVRSSNRSAINLYYNQQPNKYYLNNKGGEQQKMDDKTTKKCKRLIIEKNVCWMTASISIIGAIIFFLLYAVFGVYSNIKMIPYEKTEGVVTGFYYNEEANSTLPVITYQVGDEKFEFQSDFRLANYLKDEVIDVVYRSDNQKDAVVRDKFTTVYKHFYCFGMICAAFSIYIYGWILIVSNDLRKELSDKSLEESPKKEAIINA